MRTLPTNGRDIRDHVFPTSWYPDSTPHEVQRPWAPSCLKCNKDLGALEEELLLYLVLSLDPKERDSIGLPTKALRSVGIGVDASISPRERSKRVNLGTKVLRKMVPVHQLSNRDKFLPGFGIHPDFPVEEEAIQEVTEPEQ